MGCSESKPQQKGGVRAGQEKTKTVEARRKVKDAGQPVKEVRKVQVWEPKVEGDEGRLERKVTGKLLVKDEVSEPHFLLDDMMRSGDYLTQSKQRHGHTGALMLGKAVHTYKVLFYGLSESGKTHLLYTLINGSAVEPIETDSPRDEVLYVTKGVGQSKRANFQVTDAGGAEGLFSKTEAVIAKGVQGLVFVVDSTSNDCQLAAAKQLLEKVISVPGMEQVPVLLLASKADLPSSRPLQEIEDGVGFRTTTKSRPTSASKASIATDTGLRAAADGLATLAVQMSAIPELVPAISSPRKRSFRAMR